MLGCGRSASLAAALAAALVAVALSASGCEPSEARGGHGGPCSSPGFWEGSGAATLIAGGDAEEALKAWAAGCSDPAACERCAGDAGWLLARAEDALVPLDPRREMAALKLLRRSAEVSLVPPIEHELLDCLRPADLSQQHRKFDAELFAVPLVPGRVCDGGQCLPDRCGVSVFDGLVSPREAEALVAHSEVVLELHRSTGHPQPDVDLHVSARHGYGKEHLLLLQLVDRLRLLIAQEAGVPGSWVGIASHFLSRRDDQGDGRRVKESPAHSDEASTSKFHYSAVLWLTGDPEAGEAAQGGEVAFWDGHKKRWRREVTTAIGRAVVFSSGWENIHQVQPVRGGLRVALTLFASVGPPDENSTRMSRRCHDLPQVVDWDVCEAKLATWFKHMDL